MKTLFSFFLDWKVKLAIATVIILSAYSWHTLQVSAAVQEAVTEIRNESLNQNLILQGKSLASERELQSKFDNIQKDKDEKIKTLDARVTTLSDSLRKRPIREDASRVSNNASNTESKPGATGSELYRDDGIFLAKFAGMAEGLKVELLACYKSYDEAKEMLDKFKRENATKID